MRPQKNYDDIIEYDWNRSSLQNRMALCQRAKIFLPFAALTGYDEALQKTLRAEIAEISGTAGRHGKDGDEIYRTGKIAQK